MPRAKRKKIACDAACCAWMREERFFTTRIKNASMNSSLIKKNVQLLTVCMQEWERHLATQAEKWATDQRLRRELRERNALLFVAPSDATLHSPSRYSRNLTASTYLLITRGTLICLRTTVGGVVVDVCSDTLLWQLSVYLKFVQVEIELVQASGTYICV